MDLKQTVYIIEYGNALPKRVFNTYEEACEYVNETKEPLIIHSITVEDIFISLLNTKWDFERSC